MATIHSAVMGRGLSRAEREGILAQRREVNVEGRSAHKGEFMMRLMLVILPVLFAPLGCGGCSESLPESITELSDMAVGARDAAEAARDAKDPDAAADAADRADVIVARLIEIYDAAETHSEDDKATRKQAVLAASKARYFAELADEEQQLAEALDSWKATGYRTARVVGNQATWRGLAFAADQAGKNDLKSLPESVQESAELAADMSNRFSGRERLPDGEPDWPGISADLNSYATKIPTGFAQFVAAALLLTGQKDFALYEIHLAAETDLKTDQDKQYFHLLRGVIYSMHDWQHLAVIEIGKISTKPGQTESDEQFLAAVHFVLAYFRLEDKDYEGADREIVRAMQIWPNNPVSVFLTGEQLAASGEYEAAAKSLEQAAQGEKHEWLAKKIADRARQLRDEKAEGQTLLHDRAFMTEVVLNYVWIAAKESEPAARVKETLDSARAFGSRMIDNLPGVGAEPKP